MVKLVKRAVGDRELREALANEDNRRTAWRMALRFAKTIPKQDLAACVMLGTWQALQCHREEFGQKFTSSLCRFVRWECLREIKRLKRNARETQQPELGFDLIDERQLEHGEDAEQSRHLRKRLEGMSDGYRLLLEQYFLQGMKLKEMAAAHACSKETVRRRLITAVKSFKRLVKVNL